MSDLLAILGANFFDFQAKWVVENMHNNPLKDLPEPL